jgi:hypothetical protein
MLCSAKVSRAPDLYDERADTENGFARLIAMVLHQTTLSIPEKLKTSEDLRAPTPKDGGRNSQVFNGAYKLLTLSFD